MKTLLLNYITIQNDDLRLALFDKLGSIAKKKNLNQNFMGLCAKQTRNSEKFCFTLYSRRASSCPSGPQVRWRAPPSPTSPHSSVVLDGDARLSIAILKTINFVEIGHLSIVYKLYGALRNLCNEID
ncbi:unnamed protein product [Arctia plantaginis]|uniref:Uncharacterized protein n=1 Tax=Arctia plantaginis TaxID=874455 RepID=A0A8S0YLM9_ARCPL|nr:unnamed protein product [Arctia plantaginis]